jgi:putative addiction module CopG family antidote
MKVSLGKLGEWVKEQVKHGDYEDDSEVIREAVRRMKDSQPGEPEAVQKLIDEAEDSGFKRFSSDEWKSLRKLARRGLGK